MDFSLVLLNISSRIYENAKKLEDTAVFYNSINNETQCVPLLCL